ncbi:MAG: HAD-IIIA family hydrolase [Bacteroidia bacterium]|nr:HAD-IIIA family hydrolase [Bacteroidia bacterium]
MKNKAVFFDRDGVLTNIRDLYYLWRTEDYRLNIDVPECLSILHERGFLLVVISNQSGISRGVYSINDTDHIHDLIRQELSEYGVIITEFYYCPHSPENGNCLCRKPLPLMIEKAIARFNIDRGKSFFIGDSNRDIEAANLAGIRSYKIDTDQSIKKICAEIISFALAE